MGILRCVLKHARSSESTHANVCARVSEGHLRTLVYSRSHEHVDTHSNESARVVVRVSNGTLGLAAARRRAFACAKSYPSRF
eukprot:2451506-Pleurochrysis_carterae.AAC.1